MKNLKLSPKKILNDLLGLLTRLKGFLILLAIIGLLGYGAYLFSQIVDLQPDAAYLAQQRQSVDQTKIRFDKSTIQAINNLKQVNPSIDLTNIGKSDPFNP